MNEPTQPETLTYLSFSDYLLELDGTFVTQERRYNQLTDNEIIVRDVLPLITEEISCLIQEIGDQWDDQLDPCSLRDAIGVAVSRLYKLAGPTDFPEDLGSFRGKELGLQREYNLDLSCKLEDFGAGKSVAANLLIEFFKERLPEEYVNEINALYLSEDEINSPRTLEDYDPVITLDDIEG